MKSNLIIYSCLGILLTCCGSASEKSSDNVKSPVANDQLKANPEVDKDVKVYSSDEISAISSNIENEKEVQLNPRNNKSDTKNPQPEKDLTSTTNKAVETEKTSAVAIKGAQDETEPATASSPSEEISVQANSVFISVVPDMMQFDKEVFTVIAGQEVIIELDNPDGMQHNMVISKPGTLKIVGEAADALARDPKGAEKHYVPEIPEVLHATKLLNPGEVTTITFTAPSEPGDYPFICTFPGHWRMMNGIMKVTK